MHTHVILLRGINVGGKHRVPMGELRDWMEADLGFTAVRTYIQSGNVIATSRTGAVAVARLLEAELPRRFQLDAELIRILVLSPEQLRAVVEERPQGFGDQPETYHSDAIFLIGITVEEAMTVFQPRE
ncbi:MAG: hypothetical protein JWN72_1807, partial [Thermoleophilia bacterium]|nr:hypothetical protein [Thermoleophilia bacterium]